MKIVTVGMGYVGLSISVLLARHNRVVIVDIDSQKVDKLNKKISPIQDRELEKYLTEDELFLSATTDGGIEYTNADFVIISTPTDYDSKKKTFDTSSVEKVIEQVWVKNKHAYIIIKSTVPIGFTKKVQEKYGTDNILFAPEFLREGRALYDNLYPSRIIIGVNKSNEKVMAVATKFVKLLEDSAIKEKINVLIMEPTEAEAVKLFSNAYLALRVAYFNEIDTYAIIEKLNVKDIVRGVSLDPRIGEYYNNPSFGYGGYCLPKDTKQLMTNYAGKPGKIVKAIVEANSIRKKFIAEQIVQRVRYEENNVADEYVVGIYRLTMKKNSDNFRGSSVKEIIKYLETEGIEVVIYEPRIEGTNFKGKHIERDLQTFKQTCNLIIANRMDQELSDVIKKVYTRDLFFEN